MLLIYARHTQRSDANGEGITQIAVDLSRQGLGTPKFLRSRDLADYEEARKIVQRHFKGVQEYSRLYHESYRLTIVTDVTSRERYDDVVQDLLQVRNFSTEPQDNELLDGLLSRLILIPPIQGTKDPAD